ncbi:MAG: flavodoxin family protein [Rickettsia endosymbiont of Ixodes persulcatus]|nr:flavodoxin family protein [Rickettsia endosymbiont of Ixodes persulcatus]MCZ6920158.1 flavodoxin family protein [Rickettsia endosymbiont of Ixodes persulcatus]
MLTHHGAHGKLKLFHLEDGGFNHQRDYKMITVAIIYYSGYGHTAKVAEEINKSVKETGANVSIIQINKDKPDNIDWDLLDNADAIIFGVPTYMGSLAGPFKTLMDFTSTKLA